MLINDIHAVMELHDPVGIKHLTDDLVVRHGRLIQKFLIKQGKLF